MNFVISDVMTVQEEDPLLDIKPSPQGRILKYTKGCFVPSCPNTSKSTPEKMFVSVPVNAARRKIWFDIVGKPNTSKNPKTPFFCCQDHFDLEKDMVNFQQYLVMGNKVTMTLVRTAVPSIFVCKQFAHLCRRERIETLRKLHRENKFGVVDKKQSPENPLDTSRFQSSAMAESFSNEHYDRGYLEAEVDKNEGPRMQHSKNSVFIEMPVFENEDQPEYFNFDEEEFKTDDVIVIDDSDAE